MNKTFGDLMGEYSVVKDVALKFRSWDQMDQFVEQLIAQVVQKPEKQAAPKLQEFSFDANGSAIPHEENNNT